MRFQEIEREPQVRTSVILPRVQFRVVAYHANERRVVIFLHGEVSCFRIMPPYLTSAWRWSRRGMR